MSINTIKIYNTPTQSISIKNDAPVPELILQEKTITENGTYRADSGYAGLSKVNVEVETYFDFIKLVFDKPLDREVELTIQKGIKYIGPYVLDDWYDKNTRKGLSKINLNEVETMGKGAIQGAQILKEVNAPNLTMLPYDCFYNSLALTRLYFPKVVEVKDGNAFRDCQALKVLEFDKIETLNGGNFVRCYALETLIIRTPKVCTLTNVMLTTNTHFVNGTASIYVPDDLVEQYKVATNWVQYADMIKPLSEYVEVAND